MAHFYDWARSRGYWLRRGDDGAPTHLLLDGGKLRVPPDAHGAMLNAYAASLARFPGLKPSVVELRTPVFKMFVDLDSRFATEAQALEAKARGMPALVRRLTECVGAARALVCIANVPKRESEHAWKLGLHVVWPEVLVSGGTALRLRERMLEALGPPSEHGVLGAWESVIDATVYRANGLRMPWSAKGPSDARFYELAFVLGLQAYARVEPATVSALREALHQLSIRTFHADPTLSLVSEDDPAAADDRRSVSRSLHAYPSEMLEAVAAALPPQFDGQKFTGLVATEHCFMLRSTAKFCLNLGREHRTNNVYFMLTRKGVCQKCFCRCETTDGRKYGMCKDFSSPYWQIPKAALEAFFPPGEEPPEDGQQQQQPPAPTVSAMPSRAGKSFLSMDNLVMRSRPPAPSPPAKRKARKKA